jgi:hypothetical protein
MPEFFDTWKGRSTFAEKMEYRFKQAEAADMCQRIISVIAGKYIEQILESHERLELSIIQPHTEDSGKKIIIEVSKDADATIRVLPLSSVRYGESDVWPFIEKFLPDYYHRDDILHYDIYSRFIDHEDLAEGDAEWIYADFGSDREKVEEAVSQMEKEFAYEALESWLKTHGPESW